jgi:uncharacterized protein
MSKETSQTWLGGLFKKIKLALIRIYRAKGSPHEIALGAAIGAFWGVFPTFGLSTPLIIVLYRFFRFNLITAFAGALVSNPITSPFLLFFTYQIGSRIISPPPQLKYEEWATHLEDFGALMLSGALTLSTSVAILVYVITYLSVKRHQQKINQS